MNIDYEDIFEYDLSGKPQHCRPIDEYNFASNRRVFNVVKKRWLEKQGLIRCAICGYHRGENNTSYGQRNWKLYRDTQYKVKNFE